MRLTRAGEYAVRCILYLSGKGENVLVSKREIAEQMNIPAQFLGKIAQQLAKSGIVEITQGAKGGMKLSNSPEEISLLDVVESVIGEIYLNDCIVKPKSCERNDRCLIHNVWHKARTRLRETLKEVTFNEFVK